MSAASLLEPQDFSCLRYESHAGVTVITLNRPERRNALNPRAYAEIEAAFRAANRDIETRCVVVTGADPAFCSGEDVKEMMTGEKREPRLVYSRPQATPAAIAALECDKPVIAAVNGAAVGWGMELTLFADIRIASERAVFAELFIKRGLISDLGGLWRLPAIVGPSKAAELLFTGDQIDAQEAKRIGLVSDVVAHDELMPRAMSMASRIAANPPLALTSMKEGLRKTCYGDPREIGSWAIGEIYRLFQTEDHREGVKSFLETRARVQGPLMATFRSDGITIAYDDIGPKDRGKPLILIHGFASNRKENWQRMGWYGALERRGLRFIAYDARGHGESGKPHDPLEYTRGKMTGDLFALMDHLDIPRCDVMGFSMGARIALAAALAQPERIRDLILGGVGIKLFDPPPPGMPMADAMTAASIDDIQDPMLKSFRQFADEQGEDRLALAACSQGLADARVTPDELSSLTVNTFIVAGAHDDLAGDPARLAALIPGARSVTLPGCDHFSAIAHASYKAAVFDFMDGEFG